MEDLISLRGPLLLQKQSIQHNGTTFYITTRNDDGMLYSIITSEGKGNVDKGLKSEAGKTITLIEETNFNKRPGSMC